MGRVKKISIEKYLIRWMLIVTMGLTILFLAVIHVLSNVAIDYDIRSEMLREIHVASQNIKLEKDQVMYHHEADTHDSTIQIQVFDSKGDLLECSDDANSIPLELEAERDGKKSEPSARNMRSIRVKGNSYYVVSLPRTLKDGFSERKVTICAIVKKTDISSKYQVFRVISYLSIPLLLLVVFAGGGMFARRITRPLSQMQQVAEAVGREGDATKKMEYQGAIEEIAVLTNANNRMLTRLEDMLENQKQFTSDVAHELRTPVAVMLAQCEFARENMDKKEDLQGAIEVLERQSKKMGHIISQLLKLSRLDQNRIKLELDYVNLSEIVEAVCEDEQEKAGNDYRITSEVSENCAYVDVYLITILMHNLVSNAIKYSPKGSAVSVTMRETEKKIYIQVQDQGEGIRPEHLKYIFSRFYRVEEARNEEGFGLGLPLAMKIAQKHGGTILAESVLGEGSTFILVLPKEQSNALSQQT